MGAGGRPSKYKPEYCEMLIKHMEEGAAYESFAGLVSVAISTLYEWEKHHVEFSEAKKMAFAKSHLYWDKVGREGMYMGGKDNPFNSTIWIFNMKNRFGWADKKETDMHISSTITIAKDEEDL